MFMVHWSPPGSCHAMWQEEEGHFPYPCPWHVVLRQRGEGGLSHDFPAGLGWKLEEMTSRSSLWWMALHGSRSYPQHVAMQEEGVQAAHHGDWFGWYRTLSHGEMISFYGVCNVGFTLKAIYVTALQLATVKESCGSFNHSIWTTSDPLA